MFELDDVGAESGDGHHLGQRHTEPTPTHVVDRGDVTGPSGADRRYFGRNEVNGLCECLVIEARHVTTASAALGRPTSAAERELLLAGRVTSPDQDNDVAFVPVPSRWWCD